MRGIFTLMGPFLKDKKFVLLTFLILLFSLPAYGFISLSGNSSKSPHLDQIKRITRATYLIQHNYYDSKRINPDKMLQEGFYALSKKIPEMLVEFPKETPNQFIVSVGDHKKTFTVKSAQNLFDIFKPAAEAFAFIRSTYQGEVKKEDQEYAFISGMLQTLDPHSNILTPDVFKEFKTQTEGIYGGIGIVVGIKDEELTVIAPLEGTPATKAGLKANDKIVQIDDTSTINMSLSEAVKRLRGKVNTKVILHIQRKNHNPFEATITRKKIVIESVYSKLITTGEKRIAFLRVRSFQEDTYVELEKALEKMKATATLDGVILDLRNNPGGLLDQSIMIADKFLARGDILFTVGANNMDEETTRAQKGNDELQTPVVVLVNQGSASASEIVAGALKRNNRALILGMKTFGKGSVQSLFNLRDGSAIKLTVAQYLTPKRISIQAVGITPDILLLPTRVAENEFDLHEDEAYGEKDLDAHLENPDLIKNSKEAFKLAFLDTEKNEQESEYTFKVDEKKDFPLSLALKILSQTGNLDRTSMISQSLSLFKKVARNQDQQITEALNALGVDWSQGKSTVSPNKLSFSSKFTDKKTSKPLSHLNAGSEVNWTLTATNNGKGDVYRLLGAVKSENPVVNEREFIFGHLKPGQKVASTVTLKIPEEIISFEENLKVRFFAYEDGKIPPLTIATRFVEKPRPVLVYSYELRDDGTHGSRGNGNGIPERGETIALDVLIKNRSPYPASQITLNLKNVEDQEIHLKKGREKIGQIAAFKEARANLSFQIARDFKEDEMKLELYAYDKATRSGFSDKLSFPLLPDQKGKIDPQPKTVQATPLISITKKERSANGSTLQLSGVVEDDQALKDIMIYAGGKKVFYKAASNNNKVTEMPFTAKIPLEEGANFISIQARDNRELSTQKILSIMGAPKNTLANKVPLGGQLHQNF